MSIIKPRSFCEKLKVVWREFLAQIKLLSVALFFALVIVGICYAEEAGSATASDIALKGGMSIIDGTFITAIFMGLSSVLTAIGFIIRGNKREEKLREKIAEDLRAKIVNDPLNTHEVPVYVTCDQCAAHRASLTKRIDELGPALNRIFKKLSENDQRSEERANKIHCRIDPLIEKVAATSAEVDMLKKK